MAELSPERRRQLLRSTEEMVTAHRLEAITREHKSMSAILDTREVMELQSVQIKSGKFTKIEADSRVQSRRGGRAETDIKIKANQAVESFKERGINVQLLSGGYNMEYRIWKDKSNKPAYAEQRKFQAPELERFLCKMTKEQKLIYKEMLGAALIKLADKFREECRRLKADMDLNAVFHPEANAHRAHCLYLTMLHKHISAKTIEDPVLREMLRVEERKKAEIDARDQEKLQLLREMEEKDRSDAEKRRTGLVRRSFESTTAQAALQAAVEAVSTDSTNIKEEKPHQRSPNSSKKAIAAKKNVLKDPARSKSAKPDKLKPINIPSGMQSSDSSLQRRASVAGRSNDSTSNANSNASPQVRKEKIVESPAKSFRRKLRQSVSDSHVGTVLSQDTQQHLLGAEVQRLQHGETMQFKRTKDRSDVMQDTLSDWMLQDMQGKQISRVAVGSVAHPQRNGSIMTNNALALLEGSLGGGNAVNTRSSVSVYVAGGDDADNTLRLQQQLKIQQQQDQAAHWQAQGKAAVFAIDSYLQSTYADPPAASPTAGHMSPSGGMRGAYSPTRILPFDDFYDILRQAQGQSQGVEQQSAMRDSGDVMMWPASLAATLPSNKASQALSNSSAKIANDWDTTTSPMATMELSGKASQDTLNIVDTMRDEIAPVAFTAFEKQQELTLPSAKLLARLNIGNAASKRRAASQNLGILGQQAIELRDSFGRVGRQSKKGFNNLFSSSSAAHFEDEHQDDDVVRRLERTGELGERARGMGSFDVDAVLAMVDSRGDASTKSSSTTATNSYHSPQTSSSSSSRNLRRGRFAHHNGSHPSSPTQSPHQITAFSFGNDDDFVDEDVPPENIDLQHKLVAVWDALAVSGNDRLSFMLKYSADEYAAEMGRAVDYWACVAVCYLVSQRLLAMREKAAQGLLLVPMRSESLWRYLSRPVPLLLRMSHDALAPPVPSYQQHGRGANPKDVEPLSVLQLSTLRRDVENAFEKHSSGEDSSVVNVIDEAVAVLKTLLNLSQRALSAALERCHGELDDDVPCGPNRLCRDFVQSIRATLAKDGDLEVDDEDK